MLWYILWQTGPVELAAVGVSIAVFNQVSRIAIFPLVSVTTSFVAEEDATSNDRDKDEINGENEHNVSDSEMEELISREGKILWIFFYKTWTVQRCIFLWHWNLPPETSAASGKSSFETDSSEINIEHKRKNITSVSTALLLGGVFGLCETLLLVFGAKPILGFMGVKPVNVPLYPFTFGNVNYFISA